MSCISTRTTGRTWPNTRLPSRASSSSLDCHCTTRERSDENVSHWIFGGIDWKRRAWRRPRWVVAALSRSVAVDERRLAYVQVRFSGYIQKVFADATYQYVRKGQPLFTVYSPELVATEREYLVAKQNQQQ